MGLNLHRTLISDLGIKDLDGLSEYRTQFNKSSYDEAVKVLDENRIKNRGFRASMINGFKDKILELEAFILNLTADEDTYYSVEEPAEEEMKGKTFWVQVVSSEKEN